MPEYETVKSCSKLTINSFFCYCIQPNNFMYDNLKDSSGNLNDKFLMVLCAYVKKNDKNAERFNHVVTETMNDMSAPNVIKLISEYNHLQSLGFNLADITEKVKHNVCVQLLSDTKIFKNALETLTLNGLKKFFVKSIFESKKDFVDTDILDNYMVQLYKWFFCPEELELKSRFNVLYNRFMKRDMQNTIFCSIIDDLLGEDEDIKIKFFILILQRELKPVNLVWPYIERYLAKTSTNFDFIQIFESKINIEEYAPLFYHSILENKVSYENPDNVCRLTSYLKNNKELKRLVEVNYERDLLYKGFYKYIKSNCSKNPQQALTLINDNILDFLKVKDQSFSILAYYLNIVVTGDCTNAKQLNADSLKLIYREINEQQNLNLFNELLPDFIRISLKGLISASDVAFQFAAYYPQVCTIDMLNRLIPSTNKNWVEMIAAILIDVKGENFQTALDIVTEFGLDSDISERLFAKFYEKEYIAYKRKKKLKKIFVSLKEHFSFKTIVNLRKKGQTDKPIKKS